MSASLGRTSRTNLVGYTWRVGQLASFSTSAWRGPGYATATPLPSVAVDHANALLGNANGRDVAKMFATPAYQARLHALISRAAKAVDPADPSTRFQAASVFRMAADNPKGIFTALDPQHKYVTIRFGSQPLDDAGRALHEQHALKLATSTFCHSSYVIPKWASQLQRSITSARMGALLSSVLWPERIQQAIGADKIREAYDSLGQGSRVQLGANTVEALTDVHAATFEHEGGLGSTQSILMGTLPDHVFNGFLMWTKGLLPDGRPFTVVAGRGVDVIPFVQSWGNITGGTAAWALQHDLSEALFRPENRQILTTTDFANLGFDRAAEARVRSLLTPEQGLLRTAVDLADYASPFIVSLKNLDTVRMVFGDRPLVPPGWGDIDPTLLLRSADVDDLTMRTATQPILGVDYLVDGEVSPEFTALRDGAPEPADPVRFVDRATYTVERVASEHAVPVDALAAPPGEAVSSSVVRDVVMTYGLPEASARALTVLSQDAAAQADFRDPPPEVVEPPAVHDATGADMAANTVDVNIFSGATEDPYGPREPDSAPLEPVDPPAHEGAGGHGE